MRAAKKNKFGSPRQHRGVSSVIFTIFLWLYAVISLYPLLWMIFYSFKSNEEIFVTNPYGLPLVWKFENYVKAWTQYDVPLYFQNSVIVGAVTVAAACPDACRPCVLPKAALCARSAICSN